MGFLKKKDCDICGEKIGILGNKKLEDGNICKNCAKKLSPWFSGRRQTTLAEIRDQLEYRQENEKEIANFKISRRLGVDTMVLIDDNAQKFMISYTGSIEDDQDVIKFSDVLDCHLDVDETQTEIKQLDQDGREVSYRIRRWEYHYNFHIVILLNNPFFDEIKFQLNSFRVEGQSRHEYDRYKDAGEAICEALSGHQKDYQPNKNEAVNKTPAFCPNCGNPVTQDEAVFCQSCGATLKT